ncbi:MAG: hypothetical protein WBA57_19120 [Elainellaceae cyanobacterium]
MSTLISPDPSAPTSNRFFNRQILVTALGLAGAIALQFSAQPPDLRSVARVESPQPEASTTFYLAFSELKQTMTAFAKARE